MERPGTERPAALSLAFLMLRGVTAAAALVAGLLQTYVFVRILTPLQFSSYILIGTLGMALWLFDLGLAKVLFVSLRTRHLANRLRGDPVAQQAAAILLGYGILVLAATALCFAVAWTQPQNSIEEAADLALFFSFTALNLVWFQLRNICGAVDQFVRFEALECLRRLGHMSLTLGLLVGLPFSVFLVGANLIWALLIAGLLARLLALGAISDLAVRRHALAAFIRENRRQLRSSGAYAAGEFYLYNFPYALVPLVYGLGAPVIIVDTTLKVLRGATVLFSAGCDLLVPRQTAAFARGDRADLAAATALALVLCCVPALALGAILLGPSDRLFQLLLGTTVAMPRPIAVLLAVMIGANLIQTVANYLLIHTGFFAQAAMAALAVVAAMSLAALASVALGCDLIQFLDGYAAVYLLSALGYAALGTWLPLRVGSAGR